MDCCGHGLTRRRWVWDTLLASAGAMFAACSARASGSATGGTAEAPLAAAQKLLADNISIDVHTHGGPTG